MRFYEQTALIQLLLSGCTEKRTISIHEAAGRIQIDIQILVFFLVCPYPHQFRVGTDIVLFKQGLDVFLCFRLIPTGDILQNRLIQFFQIHFHFL